MQDAYYEITADPNFLNQNKLVQQQSQYTHKKFSGQKMLTTQPRFYMP